MEELTDHKAQTGHVTTCFTSLTKPTTDGTLPDLYGLPTLIGIIDLVKAGGVIIDFKTSGQTPNADNVGHQNEIQLTSYGILFRENTDEKESGFELHHLVKTKTPKLIVTPLPPITDAQQTRLFKQMESYVEGVEREDFVPSPGMACLSCQFINECKRWS